MIIKKNVVITKNLLHSVVKVHCGNKLVDLMIRANMLGYKVGEFVFTKNRKRYV